MRRRRGVMTLTAAGMGGGVRRTRRGLRACVAAAGLVAVLAGAVVASPVTAQDSGGGDAEVRIVARKLTNGRVEFGLQQRQADRSWGDRLLPRARFFPPTTAAGRWLGSSALELSVGEVRIVARKLTDGRIEFGLQQRQADDSWGDRLLPRARLFPPTTAAGRWLASSPLTLTALHAGSRFRAVSAGGSHTCGVRSDGIIICWGANRFGQAAAPAGGFSAVSAGDAHTCGVRSGGTVLCWGDERFGQAAAPAGRFSAVSAGAEHSCGLRSDGAIICWGANDSGQAAPPGGTYSAVSAGSGHTCGVRSDGAIICWGANDSGESDAPGGTFSAVSAGRGHTCGVRRRRRRLLLGRELLGGVRCAWRHLQRRRRRQQPFVWVA